MLNPAPDNNTPERKTSPDVEELKEITKKKAVEDCTPFLKGMLIHGAKGAQSEFAASLSGFMEHLEAGLAEYAAGMFEELKQQTERFKKLCPDLYEELTELYTARLIPEGRRNRAASHPLAAEAYIEAVRTHDRDLKSFDRNPQSPDYHYYKWELLMVDSRANVIAFRLLQEFQAKDKKSRDALQTNFPQIRMDLIFVAMRFNLLTDRNAFDVLSFPSSYRNLKKEITKVL